MSMSVSSSSDALSSLQSLLQQVTNLAGNVAGVGPVGDWLASAASAVTPGAGGASGAAQPFGKAPPPFPDGTMAALIALKGQDTGGSAQGLLSKLDTDGDGTVSQSEFEAALAGSGVDASQADALFAKLDRNGDGSVDQGELTSALRRGHGHHHRHAAAGGGDQSGLDALLAATGANGAKTQTTANSDGSSTTTITYADGSSVTMTTPAASTTNAAGTGSTQGRNPVNLIEQLIKMQAQLAGEQGTTVSALA